MKASAIELELSSLNRLAPAGYSIGIAIRFLSPLATYIEYPEKWIKEYTEGAYVMLDPAVLWGITREGTMLWSENNLPDMLNIFEKARKHGLKYGVTCSIKLDGRKSFGSFARADREFTEIECALIQESLQRLHIAHMPNTELSDEEIKTLKLANDGHTGQEMAVMLNISLQTVKSRLTTIRRKLGAKNTIEAVNLAKNLGIFEI